MAAQSDPVLEFLSHEEEDTEASTITHISEQTTDTQDTAVETEYLPEQEEPVPDEREYVFNVSQAVNTFHFIQLIFL